MFIDLNEKYKYNLNVVQSSTRFNLQLRFLILKP